MSCFISIKEKDSRDFHHILHIYRYVIGLKKFLTRKCEERTKFSHYTKTRPHHLSCPRLETSDRLNILNIQYPCSSAQCALCVYPGELPKKSFRIVRECCIMGSAFSCPSICFQWVESTQNQKGAYKMPSFRLTAFKSSDPVNQQIRLINRSG